MPPIKINITFVRATADDRKRKITSLNSVNNGVSSLRSGIDSQIMARRSIGTRLSRASNQLQNLELRLRKLDFFINQSMDKYEQTEQQIDRDARDVGKVPWSTIMRGLMKAFLGAVQEMKEEKYNIEGIDWNLVSPTLRDQLRASIDLSARQRAQGGGNDVKTPPLVTDFTKFQWQYKRERTGSNIVYYTDNNGQNILIDFDRLLLLIPEYNLYAHRTPGGRGVNINDIINFINEDVTAFSKYVVEQGLDPRTFKALDPDDMPDIELYIKAREYAFETKPTPELIAFGKGFVDGVYGTVKGVWDGGVQFVTHPIESSIALAEGIVNVTVDIAQETVKFMSNPEQYLKDTWGSLEKAYEEYKKLSSSEKAEFFGKMMGQVAVSLVPGGVAAQGAKRAAVLIKGSKADMDKMAKELEDQFAKMELEEKGGPGLNEPISEFDDSEIYRHAEDSRNEGTGQDIPSIVKIELHERFSESHIIEGDGIKKGKGVSGAHNQDYFYNTLNQSSVDAKDLIIAKRESDKFPGLYEIDYQIPTYKYGPDGDLVPTGQFKPVKDPKTVYDPNVYSDEQIIQWGKDAMQEAMNASRITGRVVVGYASNGMRFTGYIEDGKITNFFPSFD